MKILIAEDDTFFQNFYSLKLREQQNEVEVTSNGEEAIQKARTFLPQIILLDLIMPVKDGFDTLAFLKNDPMLKNIPVLVFSTLGSEQDVEKAKQLGAVDYINKSFFDFDALLTKIKTIVPDTK